MRLLRLDEHGKPAFTRPYAEAETPPYAILSHTWGADHEEVTYEDIDKGGFATYSAKPGFAKIRFCGEQAKKDGLEYFWVDSCCIDKPNFTELNEAIHSMFRWYKNARKCYAFLSDVTSQKRQADGQPSWQHSFRNSRWFKRGWTLQELLAPKTVEFFARDNSMLGTKSSLEDLVQSTTGLPREALRGAPLSDFSPNTRLQWAAGRETKKHEDKVYCLLGIFDVVLPIMYGASEDHIVTEFNSKVNQKWNQLDLTLLGPDYRRHAAPNGASLPRPVLQDTQNVNSRQELMQSLEFEQMDARQASIKTAQRTTCEWLLRHQYYTSWQDVNARPPGREILWIKGKPGAGKSTIMKFVLARAQKVRASNEIILHFFFNARGGDLEKTVLGMYRSLLLQLLQQAPDLQHVLDGSSLRQQWTVDALQELISAAVGSLGPRHLKCFIDALDECDEQDIRDMVQFFEDVAESVGEEESCLSMCFASRHYPTIAIRDGWNLVLEDQLGHDDDLYKYIKTHFRAARGTQGDDLRGKVRRKANGVFMWAVLVVDILNKEIDRGRMSSIAKKLQQIPPQLSDLFKQILLRDRDHVEDLLLCMQWILFAKRPLTLEELYIGVTVRDEDCEPATFDIEAMTRFVLNSSKGLAELTKSQKPTVQFIHESVRDFLLKDGGLQQIWPISNDSNSVRCNSHNQLKQCCHRYLTLVLENLDYDQPLPRANSNEAKKLRENTSIQFPFLEYASQNVFYHADEAAQDIAQNGFVKGFPRIEWIHATNILQRHHVRRHALDTHLSYIFAENNFARLLRSTQSQNYWQESPSEPNSYPVVAAFVGGNRDTLQVIFEADGFSDIENVVRDPGFGKVSTVNKSENALLWAGKNGNWALAEYLVSTVKFNIAVPTFQGVKSPRGLNRQWNLLGIAAEAGKAGWVQRLLDAGADINAKDNLGCTALHLAVDRGHETVAKHLLENCANPNASNKDGHTALHLASRNGHEGVVRLLIDHGANPKASDNYGYTVLHDAARNGHEAVVRLLIDQGANVNADNNRGETALHNAAEHGREAVVRVLVDHGANPNAANNRGETALHNAAEHGREAVVRVLVDHGANPNASNNRGETALHRAAQNGQGAVVQLLVDCGADLNASDNAGKTALHDFGSIGYEGIVRLLVDHGANPNTSNNLGWTALHDAARNGHEGVVRLLIENGADITAKNSRGDTALAIAVRRGRGAIVKLLESYISVNPSPQDA